MGAVHLYINVAEGYHSNDARGVTRSGENPDDPPVTPLTRATSAEIGLVQSPGPELADLAGLFRAEAALGTGVHGDAGVTSPSGSTTRTGIEWGNTYHFNRWISADLNAAFTQGAL